MFSLLYNITDISLTLLRHYIAFCSVENRRKVKTVKSSALEYVYLTILTHAEYGEIRKGSKTKLIVANRFYQDLSQDCIIVFTMFTKRAGEIGDIYKGCLQNDGLQKCQAKYTFVVSTDARQIL